MKNYTIVREDSYVSSGCSCCEPWDIGSYVIYEDGELWTFRSEFDGCYETREFGTKEDALDFILEQNKINVEYKE